MRIKTILLTGLGFLFLGLGAVGLLVPVWPTTPFVLLCAACFSGTPRLRARIMKIAFFREHIENYENRTGLTRKTVAVSLGYLWGMLLLSMLLISKAWVVGLLCAIGAAVTIHILCVARARRGKEARQNEACVRGF